MDRSRESGVAIFYILLAVVLFAALAFAFSNSMNSSAGDLSKEESRVYAQDILNYANRLGRGVQRVLVTGNCSENDISFYLSSNALLSGYIHAPEVDDQCKVFHADGGSITWQTATEGVNDGSDWVFTGHHRVSGIGDPSLSELVAILPYIKKSICVEINDILNIGNSDDDPPTDQGNVVYSEYTGSFSDGGTAIGDSGNVLNRQRTGCYEANNINGASSLNTYHFYHTLVER